MSVRSDLCFYCNRRGPDLQPNRIGGWGVVCGPCRSVAASRDDRYRSLPPQAGDGTPVRRDVYAPCPCGSGRKFKFCCGAKKNT